MTVTVFMATSLSDSTVVHMSTLCREHDAGWEMVSDRKAKLNEKSHPDGMKQKVVHPKFLAFTLTVQSSGDHG